jgi:hypothetical protein
MADADYLMAAGAFDGGTALAIVVIQGATKIVSLRGFSAYWTCPIHHLEVAVLGFEFQKFLHAIAYWADWAGWPVVQYKYLLSVLVYSFLGWLAAERRHFAAHKVGKTASAFERRVTQPFMAAFLKVSLDDLVNGWRLWRAVCYVQLSQWVFVELHFVTSLSSCYVWWPCTRANTVCLAHRLHPMRLCSIACLLAPLDST